MFKTLGVGKNFLGIEDEYSSFEKSKVAILPVPYEATVSYGGGTNKGPGAILNASHYVEFYDEETGREVFNEFGIATLEPLDFTGLNEENSLGLIYNNSKKLIQEGKFAISLGGEHTISQALIVPYAEKYPDLSVLHIDAHSDLRKDYLGNKYSHASVMARVCEYLDPNRIVQVGIRAQCIEEVEFIRENGITTLYTHEIRAGKYRKIIKDWDDFTIEKLSDNVYVTFDVDGFDPSIMPATGTPEPNGLLWHETMTLLRKLGKAKNVVGCDVVELAPMDGLHHPDLTTAKLVSKMINYFVK
ncbi:MAG: agmatinase [Bacteroidota bacterium]|nr:agmatinase [Bacteroidota bacterium]